MQASALRPGMVIKWNNDLYSIFNMVHRTPGTFAPSFKYVCGTCATVP